MQSMLWKRIAEPVLLSAQRLTCLSSKRSNFFIARARTPACQETSRTLRDTKAPLRESRFPHQSVSDKAAIAADKRLSSRAFSRSCALGLSGRSVHSLASMSGEQGVKEPGLPGQTWVLYHYLCPDGIFAALAAHLYHRALNKEVHFLPNTVYSPKRVDDIPCTSSDAVYLVDFAGPQGFAEQLAGKAGWVGVLDHHKTALETLPPLSSRPKNLFTLLDMNRSGATVAWDYFAAKYEADSIPTGLSSQLACSHLSATAEDGRQATTVRSDASEPSVSGRGPQLEKGSFGLSKAKSALLRRLFEYIEDADLWKWQLPDSKAFSSGLKDLDLEYDAGVNKLIFDQLLELRLDDVIKKGRASLAEKDARISEVLKTSCEILLGGGKYGTCLAVVCDCEVARLRSELGNRLAAKSKAAGYRAIGAIAYAEPGLEDPTLLKVSLRSQGEEDTTQISQAYNGGGHKNASSFIIHKGLFHDWQRAHLMP